MFVVIQTYVIPPDKHRDLEVNNLSSSHCHRTWALSWVIESNISSFLYQIIVVKCKTICPTAKAWLKQSHGTEKCPQTCKQIYNTRAEKVKNLVIAMSQSSDLRCKKLTTSSRNWFWKVFAGKNGPKHAELFFPPWFSILHQPYPPKPTQVLQFLSQLLCMFERAFCSCSFCLTSQTQVFIFFFGSLHSQVDMSGLSVLCLCKKESEQN